MEGETLPAWPPVEGLSTSVVPRNQAVVAVSTSTRIAAPASLVFDAVLSVADYPKWNNFCPRVTIHECQTNTRLELGTRFTFHVVMDSNKPKSETAASLMCSDMSTPSTHSSYISKETLERDGSYTADLDKIYRVAWKTEGGLMSKGLRGERFHEIIVLRENECEVRTWENQAGPLSYVVNWMMKKTLDQKFDMWVTDLKAYCEGKVSAG